MVNKRNEMVRYADDCVILCRNEEEEKQALIEVKKIEERGLTLHLEKIRIVDVTREGGFDFLRYYFEHNMRWSNAYFARHGLFTLATTHALVCQSR